MIRFCSPILAFVLLVASASGRADAGFEEDRAREAAVLAGVMSGCAEEDEKACADRFFGACGERAGWTTVAMQLCSAVVNDHWDRLLNAAWQDIYPRSSGELRDYLRNAQRQWIAWRDTRCGGYRHFDGSMYRAIAAGCWTEMTWQRLMDLREFDGGAILGDPPVAIDLDCDGRADSVLAHPAGGDRVEIIYRTGAADAERKAVVLPVDSSLQTGLCGADVTLEGLAPPEGQACPRLRIDDGRCDAVYLSRDPAGGTWRLERN